VPAIIVAAIAGLVVELCKSLGHEAGIQIVAKWGPHLTAEEAGKVWHALVEACQKHVAAQPGGTVPVPEPDSWPDTSTASLG
jgi:hypothetical protein